jgi:hypothetical protein
VTQAWYYRKATVPHQSINGKGLARRPLKKQGGSFHRTPATAGNTPRDMSMSAAPLADKAATVPAIVAHLGCHTHRATTASAAGRIDVHEAGHDHHGHKLRIRAGMQAVKGGTTIRHAGPDSTTAQNAKHTADTAADKPVGIARIVVVAKKDYPQDRARRIRHHHVIHESTTLATSPHNHALNGLHSCTVGLLPLTTHIAGAGLSANAPCTHDTPLGLIMQQAT